MIGNGVFGNLPALLEEKRKDESDYCILFVDDYFRESSILLPLKLNPRDRIVFVPTVHEPKTSYINAVYDELVSSGLCSPCTIVGIGGGITLDTAKAVANLLTNGGRAEQYQGWDLVNKPAIYKIGVPTISGTGAESSRTCVMTNVTSGLKLGMNSNYTIYDQLVLDPQLTKTVPRDQYFYTGIDSYIHCFESLEGRYRNVIGDAFSDQAIKLCRDVFLGNDMMNDDSREKLMIASYLGGCAIAHSFVGVVHPFSAGLSVVLGIHHGVGNCIVMRGMREFYPENYEEFWRMVRTQKVHIPEGVCDALTDEDYRRLYEATIIHEKPLSNALGDNYKNILTYEKVREIFKML